MRIRKNWLKKEPSSFFLDVDDMRYPYIFSGSELIGMNDFDFAVKVMNRYCAEADEIKYVLWNTFCDKTKAKHSL